MFWFDFHWQIQQFLNQFWWQTNFFLLIILVVLGYLSYKKSSYAVGLTIILLPTYLFRSKVSFLPLTFLEICIWITFIGWLINKISNLACRQAGFKFRISKLRANHYPILIILIATTISLAISPDLRQAAGLWKAYFIEPILFFLVIIDVIKSDKDKKVILQSLGISALPIALLAIYQKFSGFGIFESSWTGPDHRRVTSLFSSPNAIGLYLGPIVAIYFGWIFNGIKNVWPTIFKTIVVATSLLAILFTVSQGTWLGLAAAITFLAFFGLSKKWTSAIVGLLIILTLTIPLSREKIWPIISLQDTSGQNRLVLWQTGWEHLAKTPKNFILGAGFLGFDQIQDQARDPLKIEDLLYPHNILLNFWLEIGLAGLIAFGWLVIIFFKQGYQKMKLENKWIALGIMAAMVTIIIHGLIDVPYFKNDLAVLFWIIIALV